MDYQTKFNKRLNGFSLVELIVVLGIFFLILGISTSVYSSFKSHNNLEITTSGIVEAIRFAQSSSQSGKGDSKWGVEVLPNEVVIFKGDSYLSRDILFNESLNFAGGISASGLSEIVFEKITGTTFNTGTIILSNGSEIKSINVNEKGTVTY